MSNSHRAFALCLIALWSALTTAEPPRRKALTAPAEVHRTSDVGGDVIQTLSPGDVIWVFAELDGVARIKYRRGGAWRVGFVAVDQLADDDPAEPPSTPPRNAGAWAIGVLVNYSLVSQGERRFQTEDQVKWSTSTYSSDTIWPAAYAQHGTDRFWRLTGGLRRLKFRGHALTDIGAQASRPIEVDQNMVSVRLERGWALLSPGYLTIGAEVARALTLSATIGGRVVPTTDQDKKIFVGPSVGAGASFTIRRAVTAFIEARAGAFPTVTPIPYVFEGAAGASYRF